LPAFFCPGFVNAGKKRFPAGRDYPATLQISVANSSVAAYCINFLSSGFIASAHTW
jgi:hypothetical protein